RSFFMRLAKGVSIGARMRPRREGSAGRELRMTRQIVPPLHDHRAKQSCRYERGIRVIMPPGGEGAPSFRRALGIVVEPLWKREQSTICEPAHADRLILEFSRDGFVADQSIDPAIGHVN